MRPCGAYGSLQVLMRPNGFQFVLIGPCGSLCVSIRPYGSLRVVISLYAFFWVLLGYYRSLCVLMESNGSS